MNHPALAVTVDLALMTVANGKLAVLLQRRSMAPFAGQLALPGGFVMPEETLDAAARRVLLGKAGFTAGEGAWLEQLYTFGDPARDPRMRTVTVAYFALLPHARLMEAMATRTDLELRPLTDLTEPLAFDHGDIVMKAHDRLRGKLDYTPIAFALLPDRFTLRDIQHVHEAISGTAYHKSAFRRRMLDSGWIKPTGQRETDTTFRPAELFSLIR